MFFILMPLPVSCSRTIYSCLHLSALIVVYVMSSLTCLDECLPNDVFFLFCILGEAEDFLGRKIKDDSHSNIDPMHPKTFAAEFFFKSQWP